MKNRIATNIQDKHIMDGNIKNQWIIKLVKKLRVKNLIANNWWGMREKYFISVSGIFKLKQLRYLFQITMLTFYEILVFFRWEPTEVSLARYLM